LRSSPSDPLPPDLAAAIAAARADGRLSLLGRPLLFFESVGSTNDVAARLAEESREGAVVVAGHQTAGRGRLGRVWFSPPASGLYVSVVLLPGRSGSADAGRATTLLTLAAGLALAESIEAATGLAPDLKWPNDLIVGRRKLGGILAESAGSGPGPLQVVLGYGLNVCPAAYPAELAARATSLETELGRALDGAVQCAAPPAALEARYADLLTGRFDAILDAWRRRASSHRGARVAWSTARGRHEGLTAGVDDWGALLVRVGDRTERIVAGEISWL
jgi:BirA family biotin operon repressor/biotin-[acetyl-CoA-carboxylase] ligase